jgi:hypothetical protein
MSKKIVDIGQADKPIKDTSKTLPLVDPAQVAAALGAELTEMPRPAGRSPLGLHAVRKEMFDAKSTVDHS